MAKYIKGKKLPKGISQRKVFQPSVFKMVLHKHKMWRKCGGSHLKKRKTLENKGDVEIYEIRYRNPVTQFHNSINLHMIR